jgi:putative CRISPR-associated protein (TIGR02619 family)
MPHFVLSTIGTSLLTQQISRSNIEEKDWFQNLSDHASLKLDETPKNIKKIIEELEKRATEKLDKGDIKIIRGASAELNGIYGLYEEQLEQGKQDIHWLIATDTAQGEATAKIVQSFLEKRGISTQILQPKKLSATSTEDFQNGIDELLEWIDYTIPGYQDSDYRIIFNLVGGFKSLQAYLNTIGMFYANEIIYIFEGVGSKLITIPRLPIQIDTSKIQPVQFALMAAGAWIETSKLQDVYETLIFSVGNEATLSNWGRLTWNKVKSKFLGGDLLEFPRLQYEPDFIRDYGKINNLKEKIKIQEVLAKVSYLLLKYNGDTAPLCRDGGLLYEDYVNKGGIAHFRVTQGIRISCITSEETLILRHYGTEPEVNNNP